MTELSTNIITCRIHKDTEIRYDYNNIPYCMKCRMMNEKLYPTNGHIIQDLDKSIDLRLDEVNR